MVVVMLGLWLGSEPPLLCFQAWQFSAAWEPMPMSPQGMAQRGSPVAQLRAAQVRMLQGPNGVGWELGLGERRGVLSRIAMWHPPSWAVATAGTPQPRTHMLVAQQGPALEMDQLWDSSASGQSCNPMGERWISLCLSPPGNVTQLKRQGHFSRCPEEYTHYCVRGRCRFLVAEETPACV